MKRYEMVAMCWLIGYFILWWPYFFAYDGNLIAGLINANIGVLSTIMILWFGKRWEECWYNE